MTGYEVDQISQMQSTVEPVKDIHTVFQQQNNSIHSVESDVLAVAPAQAGSARELSWCSIRPTIARRSQVTSVRAFVATKLS